MLLVIAVRYTRCLEVSTSEPTRMTCTLNGHGLAMDIQSSKLLPN